MYRLFFQQNAGSPFARNTKKKSLFLDPLMEVALSHLQIS